MLRCYLWLTGYAHSFSTTVPHRAKKLTIGLWDEHAATPGGPGSASSKTKMRDHTEPIFTVRASSHHKFVLRADSQGEMADWLKAVKHNIEILRKPYWTKAVESMRAAACLSKARKSDEL